MVHMFTIDVKLPAFQLTIQGMLRFSIWMTTINDFICYTKTVSQDIGQSYISICVDLFTEPSPCVGHARQDCCQTARAGLPERPRLRAGLYFTSFGDLWHVSRRPE